MMKLALFVLLATQLSACDDCSDSSRRAAREDELADQLGDLAKETFYFRDHAGICWGLLWVGSNRGGPAGGPVPGVGPFDPCPPVIQAPPVERQ